ncbi:MAG: hypothetical protein HUK22_03355, partial [Thermoguttaceae bacterium]|nr:hypothetical protein [Thermoguttaceae bacterium]
MKSKYSKKELEERALWLLYGLLEEDEAEELRQLIARDAEAARIFEAARDFSAALKLAAAPNERELADFSPNALFHFDELPETSAPAAFSLDAVSPADFALDSGSATVAATARLEDFAPSATSR